MKRILKEPLLHFLLIGGLLFGAYAWSHRGAGGSRAAQPVRVAEAEVRGLRENWSRQSRREPTREELRGLVINLVKEELLAREARVMGLDQNDLIIRRRLAQKLEVQMRDTSRLAEPSEEDLRKFYATHRERFQTEPRITFAQIAFSPQQRRDAAADAKAALAKLASGGTNAVELGDRLAGEAVIRDVDLHTVAGKFGTKFAGAVFALPPGAWNGPIESGLGWHLVRVTELKPGQQREFGEAKAQVIEQWRDQREREDTDKYFASLFKKCEVVLDESVKPLVGALWEKEPVK
jgi:parvulin-like peptidyl-prolyl isomerase